MTLFTKRLFSGKAGVLAIAATSLAFSGSALSAETQPSCVEGVNCSKWAESPIQNSVPPSAIDLGAQSTLEWSRVSSRTIPGLAPDERLCPTVCPVDVMTPEGSKILDCYKICTPVEPQAHVQTQTAPQPIAPTQTQTTQTPVMPPAPVTGTPHMHYPAYQMPVSQAYYVQPYTHSMIYYARPALVMPVPVMPMTVMPVTITSGPVYYTPACGMHFC